MEKYIRVERPREKPPDNEVRINKKTPMSNYVKYILSQFKDKNANEVTLK
jgi:DNA-binding protein